MQPPATPPAPDEPLYEVFFGLREQPFSLTSDPRFLFMSDAHRRAYEDLLTGLRRREGLLLLTADTGMGKTTICRAVIDALGPRTFSAMILNPYMSDAEVVRVILRDFGLVSRDDIRKGAFGRADMPQLLDTLEQFLRSLIPLNSYAVVVIDEAQSLPAKVLDQIRQLGAYEQDGHRLLQIILAGQPGLMTTLRTDAMRAVDGRISRRAMLGPLSPKDVEGYIKHRLAIAGAGENVVFAAASAKAVADLANGVPRRINLLCDRALEEGRVAGVNLISPAMVQRGAQSLAGGALGTPLETHAPEEETAPDGAPSPVAQGVTKGTNRGLTFGYAEEKVAAPPRRRWIAALVLVVLAGAAGYFAWTIVDTGSASTPMPPTAPVLGSRPADPRPLPTEDDIRHVMSEIERANRGR